MQHVYKSTVYSVSQKQSYFKRYSLLFSDAAAKFWTKCILEYLAELGPHKSQRCLLEGMGGAGIHRGALSVLDFDV